MKKERDEDTKHFIDLFEAMKEDFNFTEQDLEHICDCLVAILYLGNLKFEYNPEIMGSKLTKESEVLLDKANALLKIKENKKE